MQVLTHEAEQELIRRSRHGDKLAFSGLYEAYQAKAYGTACLIGLDQTVAADAVQEAFIKAYLALPRFRLGEPFRPWFLRILTHETLRLLKRRSRRWFKFSVFEVAPAAAPPADLAMFEAELAAEVRQAVAQLPELERAAVVLRCFNGLSEAEVARTLGVPQGTVKSRLHRARAYLKEYFLPEKEAIHDE